VTPPARCRKWFDRTGASRLPPRWVILLAGPIMHIRRQTSS
jgi:hypothetical protein